MSGKNQKRRNNKKQSVATKITAEPVIQTSTALPVPITPNSKVVVEYDEIYGKDVDKSIDYYVPDEKFFIDAAMMSDDVDKSMVLTDIYNANVTSPLRQATEQERTNPAYIAKQNPSLVTPTADAVLTTPQKTSRSNTTEDSTNVNFLSPIASTCDTNRGLSRSPAAHKAPLSFAHSPAQTVGATADLPPRSTHSRSGIDTSEFMKPAAVEGPGSSDSSVGEDTSGVWRSVDGEGDAAGADDLVLSASHSNVSLNGETQTNSTAVEQSDNHMFTTVATATARRVHTVDVVSDQEAPCESECAAAAAGHYIEKRGTQDKGTAAAAPTAEGDAEDCDGDSCTLKAGSKSVTFGAEMTAIEQAEAVLSAAINSVRGGNPSGTSSFPGTSVVLPALRSAVKIITTIPRMLFTFYLSLFLAVWRASVGAVQSAGGLMCAPVRVAVSFVRRVVEVTLSLVVALLNGLPGGLHRVPTATNGHAAKH